jgi:hypothetical protein
MPGLGMVVASTKMMLKAMLRRATGNFILGLIKASLDFVFVDRVDYKLNRQILPYIRNCTFRNPSISHGDLSRAVF